MTLRGFNGVYTVKKSLLVTSLVLSLGGFVGALSMPIAAAAKTSTKKSSTRPAKAKQATSAKVVKGQFEYVVCTDSTQLLVRDESLKEILFSAEKYEPVKLFQGWGENRRFRQINGEEVAFIKVQFPNHEDNAQDGIGWVAEKMIKLQSECPGYKEALEEAHGEEGGDDAEDSIEHVIKAAETVKTENKTAAKADNVAGLNDAKCCNFPLIARPTASYETGMRRFGARRGGGSRIHAASDLYRRINEPIEAVASGTVVRDLYYFYQGTYALEVKHAGGFVVRYGEITGKQVKGVRGGASVKAGQVIGYIAKVNSNCCEPMLHFELYSGKRTGSLTVSGNKYRRRSDLMDPTKYLRKWEERKFGK